MIEEVTQEMWGVWIKEARMWLFTSDRQFVFWSGENGRGQDRTAPADPVQ